MNTRTIASSIAAAMIAAIVIAVTLSPAMASQPPDEDSCTIMHPDIKITNSTADQQVFGATGALQSAPLNPDFVAYWESPLKTSGDHICGYIPPPMDLSHLDDIPVDRIQPPCALPSFDWRDSGNVTSVKSQSPCGTCWTFGTTSVLESAVLINEGAEYNFSEQSVALCVDRSWVYLYDNSTDPCNAGGWGWLAAEVFIRKGSVLESCNPYNGSALNCAGSCVCDDCQPVTSVDGYRLVTNNGSEIGVIKSAVYDHGPVTMSFYWHSSGNYTDATLGTIYDCYPCAGSTNHLVSIIGWNDSIPHPNPAHDGTGAWIVKNSWGTGWGNDGFFYLAYNSSCVRSIAYLEYKDPVPGEELLYRDEAGFVGSRGYGDSGAWMASVFTADRSGNLTHIDFWTTSNNAEYEIYVWDGYFGSELANQTGTGQELGYYSIPLSTPIPMDAGLQFTVGVNMTTPGYGYPIPVEYEIAGTVSPTIQSNVSFIRQNGSCSWTDLANYSYNAGLRARMANKLPCTCGDICVNPTGWWRDGGVFNANNTAPIQAAVDNAIEGDSVFVWNGTYDENVHVNKRLVLKGGGADVVTVTADYVNISGFTVTGATGGGKAGIYLNGASHCNISDNNCTNNENGIMLEYSSYNIIYANIASSSNNRGILMLYSSNYNALSSNTANSNVRHGIVLSDSSNNTLSNNTADLNNVCGIYLYSSSNNMLTNNKMSGNTYNFGVYSESLFDYTHSIDTSNIVDGKPIYYWVGQQDKQIPSDAGFVGIVNSTNITVRDLVLTNNTYGVGLAGTTNSKIVNVTSSNHCDGIHLLHSSNNTLTKNNISGSRDASIWLVDSSNNTLTSNTVSGNSDWDIYIEGSSSIFTDNTLNGTTISFTYSGDVSLKSANSPAADPTGRQSIGKFINATNQSAGAWMFLNFSYSDSDVSCLNESSLAVWKYNGTWYEDSWNGTQYLNTTTNVVGVNITSFSVFAPMVVLPPPNITSFAPETPVSDEQNATRTFSIAINQTVNVTWLINGTIVQDTNTSVTTASYTNTSAKLGVWNVSAVASNTNGTDMQTWIWNAALSGDVTGDDVVNIDDAVLLFNWVSFPNERETTHALNKSENADVTGNGVINVGDAVLLFNWVSFPGEQGGAYVLQ